MLSITQIAEQLAPYGYSVLMSGEIVSPRDKPTGAMISIKRGRMYVRSSSGALLFSGIDAAKFVESFWFAKKVI